MKEIEFTEIDLGDRRRIEAVVSRFQNHHIDGRELRRALRALGYETAPVERYASLIESTCDPAPRRRREVTSAYWESWC